MFKGRNEPSSRAITSLLVASFRICSMIIVSRDLSALHAFKIIIFIVLVFGYTNIQLKQHAKHFVKIFFWLRVRFGASPLIVNQNNILKGCREDSNYFVLFASITSDIGFCNASDGFFSPASILLTIVLLTPTSL
jgi:hypothetical protein